MPSGKIVVALIGAGATLAAACIVAAATFAARPQAVSPPAQVVESPSSESPQPHTTSPQPSEEPDDDGGQGVSSSGEVWVSDLEPIVKTGLWYSGPATVRGQTYLHSMQTSLTGVQGPTVFAQYPLDGRYTRLTGLVGIVDGGHASEKAVFEIVVDDEVVQEVQIAIGEELVAVDVSLTGAHDLVLRVTNVSQSAYWANPVFAEFRLK